jgi:hypothetical protein
MRADKQTAHDAVREHVQKHVMEGVRRVGKKVGYKLFRRTVLNSTLPLASIYIGARWNQKATKRIGKAAIEHFEQRAFKTDARDSGEPD